MKTCYMHFLWCACPTAGMNSHLYSMSRSNLCIFHEFAVKTHETSSVSFGIEYKGKWSELICWFCRMSNVFPHMAPLLRKGLSQRISNARLSQIPSAEIVVTKLLHIACAISNDKFRIWGDRTLQQRCGLNLAGRKFDDRCFLQFLGSTEFAPV